MLAQRPASRLIRAALLIMLFVVSFRDGIERPELVQARPSRDAKAHFLRFQLSFTTQQMSLMLCL